MNFAAIRWVMKIKSSGVTRSRCTKSLRFRLPVSFSFHRGSVRGYYPQGGLGMPVVVSVFMFIFYYIIDNSGYKLARDGRWEVWEGMWLSSAVLLPLGIFLTYKAVKDSAVFNPDVYINFSEN